MTNACRAVASILIAVFVVVAVLIPDGTAQESRRTLVLVDGLEPDSLDPPVGTGQFGHPILALFEGLVAWNPKMEAVPRLATSWEVASDRVTWTFKLRSGVTFHDGSALNSEAVKYSLERIRDPDIRATRRASYAVVREIRAPDPLTVQIVTTEPFPDLPFLLADRSALIVSPAAARKSGPRDFGRNPVGTGPFMFQEWRSKDRIVMQAFPGYWGPKPKISEFVFRVIPEPAARTAVLQTGEADIVRGLSPEDAARFQANPRVSIETPTSLTMIIAQWSTTKGPFSDVRVRRAANMAVNRQSIVENMYKGLASIPRSPAPPGVWGTVTLPEIPYDPDKAKELLTAAGYPNGFSGTYLCRPDARVPLRFCEVTVYYLSRVGIKMQIRRVEQAELVAGLSKNPDEYPGDIVQPTRTSPYIGYHMDRLYETSAARAPGAQRSGYSNPQVDALLVKANSTFDIRERARAYAEAQRLVWNDHALMWLANLNDAIGAKNTVTGWSYLPSGEILVVGVEKR